MGSESVAGIIVITGTSWKIDRLSTTESGRPNKRARKMQKDKTLHFWDDFYRKEDKAREWIVQPSDALFRCILDQLPVNFVQDAGDGSECCYKVLEIGCGTSSLALDLCSFWERQQSTIGRLYVMATDVSPVCIEQQKELQQTMGDNSYATLEYRVLNVTEAHEELHFQFDLILDKGCLDTCLFRSKRADEWVKKVLSNIHSWLCRDGVFGGVYMIVTPRSKLKTVRDYPGFAVTRKILTADEYGLGDLEPRHSGTTTAANEQRQYMYICRRVHNTANGNKEKHSTPPPMDEDTCATCGVTFAAFCEPRMSRTAAFWTRHWLGHNKHCKGPS
jgi:SAM-dependent methyltransferase